MRLLRRFSLALLDNAERTRAGRWLVRNRGPLLYVVILAIIVDVVVLAWGLLA